MFYETMAAMNVSEIAIIDQDGYRLNVGIVVVNPAGQVLWCRRRGHAHAWQFPQGGMLPNESLLETMFRELKEELGLSSSDVTYVAQTQDWVSYTLPEQFIRKEQLPICIGQKQKWFLLMLKSGDDAIALDYSPEPEFDQWQWVDYWHPLTYVIEFKKTVYEQVLKEFEPIMKSIVKC